MQGVSSDLLFVLLFVLVFLGQYVIQRFRAHKQQQSAREIALPAPVEPVPAVQWQWELPPVSTGATSVMPEMISPERRPERREVPATRRPRRFSRDVLFGNQRKLQDAVVIAAIVGRCRAEEPHDIRQ